MVKNREGVKRRELNVKRKLGISGLVEQIFKKKKKKLDTSTSMINSAKTDLKAN